MTSEWQGYLDWLPDAQGFDTNLGVSVLAEGHAACWPLLDDAAAPSSAAAIVTLFPPVGLKAPESETDPKLPSSASTSGPTQLTHGDLPSTLPKDPTFVVESAPQHIWIQTSEVTKTKALTHLIQEVSNDSVKRFFCTWGDCNHPVGFIEKTQLITHIRSVHLQEKPFECTTCGTPFSRKQEAIRHVITMNGAKRYKRSVCQRTFSHKPSRDNHEDLCT